MSDVYRKLDTSAVALFLDVDGTLLDFRDNPAEVLADQVLVGILNACFDELGGAMALVSGRSVTEIDRIFAPAVFPAAGAHGAELRVDAGGGVSAANDALPDVIMTSLEALAASNDGLLVERKRGGAALHYRKAPALEDECRRVITGLLADLGDAYRLIAGKKVFEIAPAAKNKGAAILAFLEESVFAGRVPVFLGDDVTDEDGFQAVNGLSGMSIRIGAGGPSEAAYRLPNVDSVRAWLRGAILGDRQTTRNGE